jgi:hypothetical protein
VRADTSRIAAVDQRGGCEVDYIAAKVVKRCAGAATFAAVVDDIAKAIQCRASAVRPCSFNTALRSELCTSRWPALGCGLKEMPQGAKRQFHSLLRRGNPLGHLAFFPIFYASHSRQPFVP